MYNNTLVGLLLYIDKPVINLPRITIVTPNPYVICIFSKNMSFLSIKVFFLHLIIASVQLCNSFIVNIENKLIFALSFSTKLLIASFSFQTLVPFSFD